MPLPTVAGLCAQLGEHLSAAPGVTTPDTEITAVHVSELADPTPYLGGGELLLTTGMALPGSLIGCDRYVAGLRETGVVALGFGVGPSHAVVPAALTEACRRQGLPLLVVPQPTPFLTITEAYWQARTHSVRQELSDAVSGHHALTGAMLGDDPDGEVVRTLATALGAWVATLDVNGAVERVYPVGRVPQAALVAEHADRLRLGGAHSAASFDLASQTVMMLPLTVRDVVAGQLVVGSDRTLRPAERRLAVTATALLSLTRAQRSGAGAAERARRQAVAALLDMGQLDAARRLASRFALPFLGQHLWLTVVRPSQTDSTGWGERLAHAVLGCLPDGYPAPAAAGEPAWFVLPGPPDADRLLRAIREADAGATAALSGAIPAAGLHEVRVGLQARVLALPAGAVDRPRPVAAPEVADGLARLLAYRRADLAGALATYLRHRGQWDRASRELRVHRNTLRHRIARCREVSGLDVDDADTAAELWLQLRHAGLA